MPLQSSGAISISQIATEFGGTAPHSLSEYYRDGDNVNSTKTVDADGTLLTGISGSNAPRWQGGTPANNLRVFQGLSASPSVSSGSADANRYLSDGSTFVESEDSTCYPKFANQNNGTWTAPYAGTVHIICVGGGASASYWGSQGHDSGAGGGAVYATATVASGATLNWTAGGAGHRGSVGPHPGNQNRGGGGGGGTSQVTGTNSGGTAFTVRALGGQWSPFSWEFHFGTITPQVNSRNRTAGGIAYANGGCTQVAAYTGGHGFWSYDGGGTEPSGWGDSGFNSLVTSTSSWAGHTAAGYYHSSFTDLSFNTSTGVLTTGSGGWGQGGFGKTSSNDGTASVGAAGVVFIWMDPKQTSNINGDIPTSGTISMDDFYDGDGA